MTARFVAVMQTVRVYDPTREPHNWMGVIRETQFAAFPTLVDSGALCDAAGMPVNADAAVCVIFDALAEAETFCRERVERTPALRFDIFDAAGRRKPPLLTIVHASRTTTLEGSSKGIRRTTYGAVALLVAAPLLFWFDWGLHEGLLILPTILGINALLIAGRLLQLNSAYREAERTRRERLAEVSSDNPRSA